MMTFEAKRSKDPKQMTVECMYPCPQAALPLLAQLLHCDKHPRRKVTRVRHPHGVRVEHASIKRHGRQLQGFPQISLSSSIVVIFAPFTPGRVTTLVLVLGRARLHAGG